MCNRDDLDAVIPETYRIPLSSFHDVSGIECSSLV